MRPARKRSMQNGACLMNPGLKDAELLLIQRPEGQEAAIKLNETCHAILHLGTCCL